MKKIFFASLLFANITRLSAQVDKGVIDSSLFPLLKMHQQEEFDFDKPTDPARWMEQKKGLQAAFGSTDKAYFRTEVPYIENGSKAWEATAWKGERINAILLTWSGDSINQVRFTISDIKHSQGYIINKKQFRLNMIRYVLSNYPYDAKEVSCGEGPTNKAWLMPDRFEAFDRFDIPARTVRPVWLSLDIPSATVPGIYTGTVEVKSEKETISLPVRINVQNQVLPAPKQWSFRLDLWQNPSAIADYYKVKPWSPEHTSLLKQHMKPYADAGGKFITTYAVHSPWSDNSYWAEGGMIEWIKRKDGSWKFDYSIFDQYVQLAIDAGIDKAITIYTPIPWGERFRYIEEATGNYIYERWIPTTDTFRRNWHIFLTDLEKHLQQKGWISKTYLGINENAMEQTLAAIKVIKDHSKEWKITYAGDWHPELDNLLDDYSCVYGKEPDVNAIKKRAARGQTSTYYVCCTPAKPNTFVFSPPVEGRWIGWYTMAQGYDGFLRWAYDAWPADPARDPRHVLWPSGDCFMVYPGGASNVRFEKMREGIADYEKVRILKAKAVKSTDASVKKLLRELEQHLTSLQGEKEFKAEKLRQDIQKGTALVNELGEKLK